MLHVPLRKEDRLLGVITVYRRERQAFTDQQIRLLESFAEQAVIAMENARLLDEQREALERQTATAEVLQVINSSPGDLAPVFDAMLEKATRLCEAKFGNLLLYDGQAFTTVADRNLPPAYAQAIGAGPIRPGPNTALGRMIRTRAPVHVTDMLDDIAYAEREPLRTSTVELGEVRSMVAIPLMKEGDLVGAFTIYRREAGGFAENQIALVTTFAAQAVIAIQNARLITETREALEQQTATAEVLEVINSSPGDLAPVFDAMLEKAMRLCVAAFGYLMTYDGKRFAVVANKGLPPRFADYLRNMDQPRSAGLYASILAGAAYAQESDLSEGEVYRMSPLRRALVDLGGARTGIVVALRKDDALLGVITIYRQEVRPFASKEITLLESFAAQAVIAIENARLINEQREALEQQTATAEILTVISQSPTDVGPVLSAVAKAAMKFCGATDAQVSLREGDEWFVAAHEGPIGAMLGRRTLTRHTAPSRAMIDGKVVQITDLQSVEADEFPEARELGTRLGFRSALAAPLLRDDVSIGAISLRRREAGEFSPRQVELLKTFAAQAVIAIENVRLFTELRESLEQQTASAEILQVISELPTDVQPVLKAVVAAARRFCGAEDAAITLREGSEMVMAAHAGGQISSEPKGTRTLLDRSTIRGRSIMDAATIQMPDVLALDPTEYGLAQHLARTLGFRAIVSTPMLRDDRAIGCITLRKADPVAFTQRQVELLETFAAQAVIAIENVRLFTELRQRTDDLTQSLEYQTATSDVLKVISRSTFDLQPVLDTLSATAARLCAAELSFMTRREGDAFRFVTAVGATPETTRDAIRLKQEVLDRHLFRPGRDTITGRVVAEGGVVQIVDVASDAEYALTDLTTVGKIKTLLGVPLMREGEVIGTMSLARQRIEPFTDKQIELIRTFADQAVIAMENARLLGELTRREQELSVTFEHMGDGVAMFDAEPRLAAWNRNFEEIIGLPEVLLSERPSYADYLRMLAERGEFGTENVEAELASRLEDTDRELRLERTRADGTVIEVRRNAVPGGGFVLIYSDVTEQRRAEAEIRAARDAAEAALERQTATADILKVIASSPTDVQPVLDAVAKAAQRFCGAVDAVISLREDDEIIRAAHQGSLDSVMGRSPIDLSSITGRTIINARTVHIPDIAKLDRDELATTQALAADSGARAAVAAPLLREGIAVGCILLRKREPGPFEPDQIELLESFAAQAVIAIENVRLFTELKESLEQQTATSEILRAISQSPTDVQPVLDAVVKAAVRFCGAADAMILLRDGDSVTPATHEGPLTYPAGDRVSLDRTGAGGRAIVDARTCHLPDIEALDPAEFVTARRLAALHGFRAVVAAPLKREDAAIGAVVLRKPESGPFTPQQIALLETFAAQAVIAIENVRLFTELRESLEQQTASAEVLRAISRSPTDVQPVFDVIAESALRLLGGWSIVVWRYDGEHLHLGAIKGGHAGSAEAFHSMLGIAPPEGTFVGDAIRQGKVQQIVDVEAEGVAPGVRELARLRGWRSNIAVPLMREGEPVGVFTLARTEPGAFSEREIHLLQVFANQAVIAVENVRLFTELRDSLERLRAAQANLIQAEKMASLGQLTAGIAHEIKNPLNFVNNFAGLSSELLDELRQAVEALLAEPDEDKRVELQDTMDLLTGNLTKIVEHGKRADGIVKSMLSHSRGGTGDWQESNINALVEEALNLAYHGARAQDKDFNVTLERDFAPETKSIEVVPQDVTRVFLNLFGNGFYATRKRYLGGADAGYRPTLRVSTRDLGEAVEVRVRDNGTGIQPEARAKLFQPFFTTKPTGEGTGLGLSISYDIVTQQHGGTIEVESEPGSFTEFTVRLPRSRRAAQSRGA